MVRGQRQPRPRGRPQKLLVEGPLVERRLICGRVVRSKDQARSFGHDTVRAMENMNKSNGRPTGAPVPAKEGSGPDQRKFPRSLLSLLIQVRASSIEEFKSVHCENISFGGMFLRTTERRELNEEVFFQFTLAAGGTLIEGLGRVVRITDSGLGIEFVSVLEPSATIIKRLVGSPGAAQAS